MTSLNRTSFRTGSSRRVIQPLETVAPRVRGRSRRRTSWGLSGEPLALVSDPAIAFGGGVIGVRDRIAGFIR